MQCSFSLNLLQFTVLINNKSIAPEINIDLWRSKIEAKLYELWPHNQYKVVILWRALVILFYKSVKVFRVRFNSQQTVWNEILLSCTTKCNIVQQEKAVLFLLKWLSQEFDQWNHHVLFKNSWSKSKRLCMKSFVSCFDIFFFKDKECYVAHR